MKGSEVAAALEKALTLHQQGRLREAGRLYDKILTRDATNSDALNLRGLIAMHEGDHAQALRLFERAASGAEKFPEAHFNKAMALTAVGNSAESLQSYNEAIRQNPAYAEARLNAGSLLLQSGKTAEALEAFRAMTAICPQDPRGYYNLGYSLTQSASLTDETSRTAIVDEAVSALMKAQTLAPRNADILLALADAFSLRGAYAPAIENLRAALATQTTWPAERRAEIISTIGEHLRKLGQFAQAAEAHREAVALSPRNHLIRFNLATALQDARQLDEAELHFKQVIAEKPDFVKAYINLGNVYRDKSRHEDAISVFEKSLSIEPTRQAYANIAATATDLGWFAAGLIIHNKAISLGRMDSAARYNRALALLNLGRFDNGWAEHEARFDVAYVDAVRRPSPEWRGEDLAGKRILVWMEQGAGDQILHASMIHNLMAQAGHVLIECLGRLAPVFARSFPGTTVIPRVRPLEAAANGQSYDFQIAAGSLGKYLRPDFASFPAHTGFLKADRERVEKFRTLYAQLAAGRRIVGIAWRSLNPRAGANKSTSLNNLAPILKIPGLFFVNLQYGDCAADLSDARARFGVDVFQDPEVDQLKDMDIFFAQVAALDLVVTASNTSVHVAGSQNIPTHLMLPHGKGTMWYWFLRRADSPWYPLVKITRAREIDPDRPWEIGPAASVAAEIATWAETPEDQRS